MATQNDTTAEQDKHSNPRVEFDITLLESSSSHAHITIGVFVILPDGRRSSFPMPWKADTDGIVLEQGMTITITGIEQG